MCQSAKLCDEVKSWPLAHLHNSIWQESASQCRLTAFQSLGREDPLEKEMATHSSILAWKIPRTEEPGGLQSTESQRVRYD